MNAKIERIHLGQEDPGIMTVWIHVKHETGNQGFGGYCLDTYDKAKDKRVPHVSLSLFVTRVMEVVGVEEWGKLVGKSCRVIGTDNKLEAIGHFIDDKWFYPAREL